MNGARGLQSFRELRVWQEAHQLVLEIYRATNGFPAAGRFGLTLQIRRSAVSVPANIAEGYGRRSRREYLNHLNIAQGSLEETKYYLILSHDLEYMAPADFERLSQRADTVGRLLRRLVQSLEAGLSAPNP